MNNNNRLQHLPNEIFIGARNNNLCSYLVALEGWRRGLRLTWYSRKVRGGRIHAPGRVFSLSDGEKTHFFYKAKGDKVSREAIRIGANKDATKQSLTEAGIPVPQGRRFLSADSDEEIVRYCNEELKYPVVIKPTDGYQGIGVIANIQDEQSLIEAIQHVRHDLNKKDVLVESFIRGEEFRFYVIENKVEAIINRTPANIIGDGQHTIEQLVKMKNAERKKNPRLFNCLIEVDFEIEQNLTNKNLNLQSIPAKNEVIMLRNKSNISTGGDSRDMLAEMPDKHKQLAIDTLKALPNLPHGGVDMIVDMDDHSKSGVILEINAIPQIGSLVFPMEGFARDIPSAIIDYYFPNSKSEERLNDDVFFDFRQTLQPLHSKIASEITVTDAPQWKNRAAIKYIVSGDVQKVGYRRWIRKKALESDLFGHAQNLNDGTVEVLVAGEAEDVIAFKEICLTGPKRASVQSVTEEKWTRPIKVGFEIKADEKPKAKKPAKETAQQATLQTKLKRKIKALFK